MGLQVRVGIPGECMMCHLPTMPTFEETAVHAFAAAIAMSETVDGKPDAFDVCDEHRGVIELHRGMVQKQRAHVEAEAAGELWAMLSPLLKTSSR